MPSINQLIEESSTILWNGPAGYIENSNFAKGSIEIANKIVEKNKNNTIYSVAGGGGFSKLCLFAQQCL